MESSRSSANYELSRNRAYGGRGRAPVEQRGDGTVAEQDGNQEGVEERLTDVALHQPVVVDDAGDGARVHQAVEQVPTFAAEAADPAGGGRHGQRDHEHEPGEAHGDVRALGYIAPDLAPVEEFVHAEIGGEVQKAVEEGKEADHAAETDQVGLLENLAQRRDGECEDEEADGPIAGEVGDVLDRIGREVVVPVAPRQPADR